MQRRRGIRPYNPPMQNADLLLKQLSENSRAYRDPLAAIDWPSLAQDGYWLPEPALSLYGLAEYDTLAEGVKRRLSQYEFINTLCCGLWLESLFLQRLSRRLTGALPRAERVADIAGSLLTARTKMPTMSERNSVCPCAFLIIDLLEGSP